MPHIYFFLNLLRNFKSLLCSRHTEKQGTKYNTGCLPRTEGSRSGTMPSCYEHPFIPWDGDGTALSKPDFAISLLFFIYRCYVRILRRLGSRHWDPLRTHIWAEGQWDPGVFSCLKLWSSPHVRRPWKLCSHFVIVCVRVTDSPTVPGRRQPQSWHWPRCTSSQLSPKCRLPWPA